jgi:hypothetical protein
MPQYSIFFEFGIAAVAAANRVADFFETVTAFQDTKIAQNAFVDAFPAAHIALNELVYSSIQLILNASSRGCGS